MELTSDLRENAKEKKRIQVLGLRIQWNHFTMWNPRPNSHPIAERHWRGDELNCWPLAVAINSRCQHIVDRWCSTNRSTHWRTACWSSAGSSNQFLQQLKIFSEKFSQQSFSAKLLFSYRSFCNWNSASNRQTAWQFQRLCVIASLFGCIKGS